MTELILSNFEQIAHVYIFFVTELYQFLAALLFAYWIRPFLERKKSSIAVAFAYWALMTLNSHTGTDKNIDRIIAVLILVFTFFLAWFLDGRRNMIQKIFICMLFRLISWLALELFIEIGFYERDLTLGTELFNGSVKLIIAEFFIWNLIQYGLTLTLLYFVIHMLHRVFVNKTDELTWLELAVLLTPALSLLLVKPIIASYFYLWMDGIEKGSIKENIPANPFRILFCILSFFLITTTVALYQRLKEIQEENFIKESVAKQRDDALRYTTHVDELYEEIRALKHDIGNHLTVIEGLAENENTKELAQYIRELQDRFYEIKPSVASGNAVTDIILSEACERCRKENISFKSEFAYPDFPEINPFDMSVVLTNAFQNAMDASKNIDNPEISIKSVSRENCFIISIKNRICSPVKVNDEGLIDTTKKKEGHGYGLKNIRNIACKYKGDIEIHQESSGEGLYFVMNVMMTG